MRKLPILFNTEMVRAILDGRKTQTRRVIKPQPTNPRWNNVGWLGWDDGHGYRMKAPCAVGDVLWVRETWKQATLSPAGGGAALRDIILYKADEPQDCNGMLMEDKWHPSIHMPRTAARIFLRVKDVRVERLQDCGNGWCIDIEREGIKAPQDPILYVNDDKYHNALTAEMEKVWDETINPIEIERYGWCANPWVWVIEFNIEHIEGRKWVEAP